MGNLNYIMGLIYPFIKNITIVSYTICLWIVYYLITKKEQKPINYEKVKGQWDK